MKIAAIVICYNDDYKFKEWIDNYEHYKDSLYRLIIVDNGSEPSFLHKVESYFKEATIIRRSKNGGTTAAYNQGIRLALSDKKVDSIMLIGNDMKIENESVKKIYKALFSSKKIGMVEPVILEKDSDIINEAGARISYCFFMKENKTGEKYDTLEKKNYFVDAVAGGMNLARREFYEKVGLQDELLFMYSDEVDMGTRAKVAGYKILAVGDAVAWHQHINKPGRKRRLPYTDYLIARNKVYLGKKHYGKRRGVIICAYMLLKNSLRYGVNRVRKKDFESSKYALRGAVNGFCGNMKLPDDFELC